MASITNQAVLEGVMVTKKAARCVAALQHSLSVEKERVSELANQVDETEMQKIVLIKNQKIGDTYSDTHPIPNPNLESNPAFHP